MARDVVLGGSSESSSFNDLCRGLGADCPDKGDRPGWGELFRTIDQCERDGLIEVDRVQNLETKRMEINTLQLTEAGATIVRAKLDQRRGLFGIEGV